MVQSAINRFNEVSAAVERGKAQAELSNIAPTDAQYQATFDLQNQIYQELYQINYQL
jgi:hypothetical protein